MPLKPVYHVRQGETLDEIVRNTATINVEAAYQVGEAPAVEFPNGSRVQIDEIRTYWFLSRWDRGEADG